MQSLDHQEAILQRLDGVTQVPRPEQSAPAHALFQHLAHRGGLDNYATDSIRWKTLHSSTLNRVATGQGEMVIPPAIENKLQQQFLSTVLGTDGKNQRQSQIHEAHKRTFEWIFDENVEAEHPWDKFVEWCEKDSLLYWITGKAGSGKSTLMKFISQHPQLMKHLQVWSNGAPVTIASFYFWASGTAMQASSEGLFRSLLYQLLDQHKHIIPKLAPQTWEGTYLFGAPMPMVQADDLRRMLGFTIREVGKTSRICLIIDGLDEFGGSTDDVLDTIEAFTSHSIKVCAASRPWVAFEESFYQKPQLLLQNLTRQDMEEYTQSALRGNRGFRRLRAREPDFAEQLARNIVDKADGVFLWVCLVVKSLLTGLNNDDRISDLQGRLDALPPDLEDLYDAIIKTWDTFYFEHAAQYFELKKAHTGVLEARILFLADAENISHAIEMDNRPISQEEYDSQLSTIRPRLNSRCMGLLEVTSIGDALQPHPVEYLHRTVKDYLRRHDVQARLQAATELFDPYLQLCAAYLLSIKSMPSYITGQDRKIDITLRAFGVMVSARWVATGNTEIMVEILDKVALPLEKEGVLHNQERSPWWQNATFSSH